jgi:hypothetical protein
MREILLVTSAVVVLTLATACGDAPGEDAPRVPDASELVSPTRPLPSPLETPFTSPPAGPGVTGEAPAELLARIVEDAAARSAVSEAEVSVVRDESVTWSDGSLGCPQPGMSYTQALVPGYWVVVEAGGATLDYRATQRGSFVLCEGGGDPPAGSAPTR